MSYSNKDFTGVILVDRLDMDGQTIKGSCFSQEKPNTKVFPENMSGVTFINCNLDNCKIPDGNAIIDCSQKKFMAQEDGFDWIIDDNGTPIERIG